MAGEEMGDRLACRVTLKPGPERDPLACTLGLHPLTLAPHPQPPLPGISLCPKPLLPP